jgi:MFS family permease
MVSVHMEGVRLIAFSNQDPECAANWSTVRVKAVFLLSYSGSYLQQSRKILVLIIGLALASNSTLGSSLPSGASHYLSKEFNVSSAEQLALPNSVYLIGYVFGPPLFSPLSEMHGRRIVMLSTFFGFTVFTLACALAPTWTTLLTFRFLSGAFASAPITVVGGIFADIYDDPVRRGQAIALIGVSILRERNLKC